MVFDTSMILGTSLSTRIKYQGFSKTFEEEVTLSTWCASIFWVYNAEKTFKKKI